METGGCQQGGRSAFSEGPCLRVDAIWSLETAVVEVPNAVDHQPPPNSLNSCPMQVLSALALPIFNSQLFNLQMLNTFLMKLPMTSILRSTTPGTPLPEFDMFFRGVLAFCSASLPCR